MKYLDDEILANFPLPTHDDVSGKYYVYEYNRWDSDDEEGFGGVYKLIFVGNVFVTSDQSTIDIYLNDIIESRKPLPKVLDTMNNSIVNINNYSVAGRNNEQYYTSYKVSLSLNGMSSLEYNVDVYNAYHYPTHSYDTNMIGLPAVNESVDSTVMLLREGYDANTGKSTLIPRIPHIEESYYGFGAFFMPTYKYLVDNNSVVKFNLNEGNTKIKEVQAYTTHKYHPQYNIMVNPYQNVDWIYYTYEYELRWNIEYTGSKKGENETVQYLMDTFGMSELQAMRTYSKEEGLLLADLDNTEIEYWVDKIEGDNVITYTSQSHTVTKQVEHVRDVNSLNITMTTTQKYISYDVIQEVLDEEVDRDVYIHDFLMDVCHKTDSQSTDIWNRLQNGEEVTVFESETSASASTVYGQAMRYGEASIDTVYKYKQAEVKIADIDYCPDRYYLMWYDRFGGLQCQPFAWIETYSEKFTNTRILNQYNQKRNGIVEVEPDWKLQSKWIPETEYPLYESLFTSSRVVLVDTESKVCQNVLITDTSYTEKNRRNNSHQLLNFTINVQLNKNQRIIY